MYCYSNNGYSMRAWNDSIDILPGEVFFDHIPNTEELNIAFPSRNNQLMNDLATKKINELAQSAAIAYVAGFYSEASGSRLYYDSDEETQKLIDGIYTRTKETDWETKVRYPGVAAAGLAPIRARPTAADPDSMKSVQFLNKDQIKILIDDLDGHLFSVKSNLWLKQGEVKVAYEAGNIEGIKAVTW